MENNNEGKPTASKQLLDNKEARALSARESMPEKVDKQPVKLLQKG